MKEYREKNKDKIREVERLRSKARRDANKLPAAPVESACPEVIGKDFKPVYFGNPEILDEDGNRIEIKQPVRCMDGNCKSRDTVPVVVMGNRAWLCIVHRRDYKDFVGVESVV